MTHQDIRQLIESNKDDEAARGCTELLKQNPSDAIALGLLAVVAIKKHDHLKAKQILERALKLRPNGPDLHHNLGAALRVLGDFEESERHYREAIRLKPDYCEAYFNLSAARRFENDDPVIGQIESMLKRDGLTDEDRCFLHFAAGKMYNDFGEYDQAFEHYRLGNQTRGRSFTRTKLDQFLKDCREVFDAAFTERLGQGVDDATPVFIVGMPRTGTTLVEQVLASHPAVIGAGELNDIMAIAGTLPQHAGDGTTYPRCVAKLSDQVFRGFGVAYLNRLRRISNSAKRIVDKMPQNFLHLGMIALMLPQARIIHCLRDPLDTCLSCYFQRFRAAQDYSYDLDDLAYYYRSYEKLMAHWRTVIANPIFELQYESLVENQEDVTRQLIDFCGLRWHDDCMQFHKTDRPVTTASNWQVRQPINRAGLKRWQRYEKHLKPLIDAMEKYA